MWGSEVSGRTPDGLVVLAVAAVALSGCFVYQPLDPGESPAPGQDVRLRYEDARAIEVPAWQRRGIFGTTSIQGRVIDWGADSVTLAVFPPLRQGVSRTSPHPDTLRFPLPEIQNVEGRELSWSRTAAFGAGATVVGAFVLRALFRWTRTGTDSGDPPGPGA
jgi:hypothetical protein